MIDDTNQKFTELVSYGLSTFTIGKVTRFDYGGKSVYPYLPFGANETIGFWWWPLDLTLDEPVYLRAKEQSEENE